MLYVINYANSRFRNAQKLNSKTARKYGYLRSNDIAKFQELAEEKIKTFKKLK